MCFFWRSLQLPVYNLFWGQLIKMFRLLSFSLKTDERDTQKVSGWRCQLYFYPWMTFDSRISHLCLIATNLAKIYPGTRLMFGIGSNQFYTCKLWRPNDYFEYEGQPVILFLFIINSFSRKRMRIKTSTNFCEKVCYCIQILILSFVNPQRNSTQLKATHKQLCWG